LCSLIAGCVWAQAPAEIALSDRLSLHTSLAVGAPAFCPKYGWEYPYTAKGYVIRPGRDNDKHLAFRLHAQSRKYARLMESAGRMLLRLWDFTNSKIGIDHPAQYGRIVDVYLAEGGKPGGEQGFFVSKSSRDNYHRYNAIYIYHLQDFTYPAEMAREVAHEYGHAVLPPVGGFQNPEDWGNGYLGENLFLKWMAADKALAKEDAMGATKAELDAWVRKNVTPLERSIWRFGPQTRLLAGKGQRALDEYVGLFLYVAQAFPDQLGRCMLLAGGQDATSALNGVMEGINERSAWVIEVPAYARGDIWLPIRGKVDIQGAKRTTWKGEGMKVTAYRSRIEIRR
nr:hypothetical protein [Armatimonadota bacterium]